MEPKIDANRHVILMSNGHDHGAGLAGLHILIVEDMGLVAHELQLMLEGMKCRTVGVVSRLSDAVKMVTTTQRLDGVLLDLNLSGQSSYPVAEILHARGIPFIIMSGYDASHIRADCANDPYLQKPFDQGGLARLMNSAFLSGKDE